jgi:DNA-directed RNA polymerase specialized sigma24 family protein
MELETTKSKRQLYKLKNSELISRLNICSNEFEINELKREFYFRFAKYMYKVCLVIVDNRGWKQDIAEDIFQETIKKVLCNVQKFRIEVGWNEEVIRKKILSWLGTIANNELKNFFKKFHTLDEWAEEINDLEDETNDESIEIPISLERAKLQNAYAKLNAREQYLIDMCAIYHCLNLDKDEPDKHFPEPVISIICDKLQTNRNALRIFKKRTIEKLLKHLNQTD